MLSRDFREFLILLNEAGVKHLIVGGYAVAFHGYPRYTKDIDIWIKNDRENIDSLLKVLDEFGFASLDLKPEDFTGDDTIIQLGYPPNRIDIICDLGSIDFDECYAKRDRMEIDDVLLSIIDMESLIRAKKAAGRHQDLADVENLEG